MGAQPLRDTKLNGPPTMAQIGQLWLTTQVPQVSCTDSAVAD